MLERGGPKELDATNAIRMMCDFEAQCVQWIAGRLGFTNASMHLCMQCSTYVQELKSLDIRHVDEFAL